MLPIALNQVSVPHLACADFIKVAKRLGCAGIELRNDLGRPLFDGTTPDEMRNTLSDAGLNLHAVAEVYGFNALDADGIESAKELIGAAAKAGASSVALIPRVGGGQITVEETAEMLSLLAQPLKDAGIKGAVEPIGFEQSTLRFKRDAVHAFKLSGTSDCFGLVHDTFHHYLADETEFFADQTILVHASGVTTREPKSKITDAHRGLVDEQDVMGNIVQLRSLQNDGYEGPVSIEAFSPEIQQLDGATPPFTETISYLSESLVMETT